MRIKLADINRDTWLRWTWHDVTQQNDAERMLIRGHERTPAEVKEAAAAWVIYMDIRQRTHREH